MAKPPMTHELTAEQVENIVLDLLTRLTDDQIADFLARVLDLAEVELMFRTARNVD